MNDLEQLVDTLVRQLFIPLEASGRHVHVTESQARTLFGHGLTPRRPLSQPGQFLANERLTLRGPKGEFVNVAVLGPERKTAQAEISLTDSRTLGLTPPVRLSGHTEGTPGAELIGPQGRITLDSGVIVAQRHIHMTPQDASRLGLKDGDTVRLRTYTARPVVLEDVPVRVRPDFATYAHLDYDEANGCGFRDGDLGRIVP